MSDTATRALCERIEAFFQQGRCFLLAKGRVGLYAGLRGMELPRGTKIIVPGYTCMVVPAAIQYAGLEPLYVDIDPATYNLNPALLRDVAAGEVSAVVVQHTYGIPCDMAAIEAWAKPHGIPIVEDACHTFGGRTQGRLCGTLGVFAFMSGQWNKPFSTGLGGVLLVNDASLAEKVGEIINKEASPCGFLRNLMLAAQIRVYGLVVNPRTAGKMTDWYRFLTRHGLVIGSSSNKELKGILPDRYFMTMAACQARKGLHEMARVEENIGHRKKLAAYYSQRLPEIGFTPLRVDAGEEQPLVRYPVRVANKKEVLHHAKKEKVEIGSWFEVPLHPAGTRMEDFGYQPGMCPEGETASEQVINLPTHLKVDEATAEKSLEFLRKHAEPA